MIIECEKKSSSMETQILIYDFEFTITI